MSDELLSKKERQQKKAAEQQRAPGAPAPKASSIDDMGYTPPSITRNPMGQTVAVGGKIRLTAGVKGIPLPKCRWKHNGNLIDSSSGNVLTIPNCRRSHGGNYTVEAYNIVGVAVSRPAVITVRAAEASQEDLPAVVIYPNRITVVAGQEFAFRAQLTNHEGAEPKAFQWYKDGKRIKGATQAILKVSRAKEKYVGNYVVVVDTGENLIQSDEAALELKKVPLPALAKQAPHLPAPLESASEEAVIDAIVGAAEIQTQADTADMGQPSGVVLERVHEIAFDLNIPLAMNDDIVEAAAPLVDDSLAISPRARQLQRKKILLERLLRIVETQLAKPMAGVYNFHTNAPAQRKSAR